MKLRWWLLGTVAVAVGGAFLLSHVLGGKEPMFSFENDNEQKSLGEFPPVVPNSAFEEIDFLA